MMQIYVEKSDTPNLLTIATNLLSQLLSLYTSDIKNNPHYENEFKFKFDITLENEHIIPNEQMNFNIITNYEEGFFRFDYNNRKNNV